MIDPKYLATLREAFLKRHGCRCYHLESTPVIERFQDKVVWAGDVEVFELFDLPETTTGYAWAEDKQKGGAIVTVLQLPPVVSASSAVRTVMAARGQADY